MRFPIILIAVFLTCAAAAADHVGAPELIRLDPQRRWADDHPGALRSRSVQLDATLLTRQDVRDEKRLRLTLFPGESYVARFHRIDPAGAHGSIWYGTLEGLPGSSVLLAIEKDAMVVDLATPDEQYEIRMRPGGGALVRQVDPGLLPPCAADGEHDVRSFAPASSPSVTQRNLNGCTDDGSVFDLLVAYTPAARSAAGGTNAIVALINSRVATSNTAYQNSLINTTANLVGTVEVNYVESGNGATDLRRLRETSDGFMDGVHPLRDSLDADLVSLIVNSAPGLCGIANFAIAYGNTPFPELGFSLNVRHCGGQVFAHELGHNQGCRHDRATDSAPGAFDYSHGYHEPQGVFRTIMSYGTVPRITHFSNPDVLYQGIPTGIDITDPDSAHCAMSINETALNVANLRCSFWDCNNNTVEDSVDVAQGTSLDCNGNDVPDECETDCNANNIPDECDILNMTSEDCQQNGVPDECDYVDGALFDCNGNTLADICEIADGVTPDCNLNSIPDDCEPNDCNSNGVPDDCDLTAQTSADCNLNAVPDECDIDMGTSQDADGNDVADECEDCNGNATIDSLDIADGFSADANLDTIPDECERVRNLDRGTFHATINLALEFAGAGETIEAGPGIYRERVDFQGTDSLVRSSHGAEATVIDAGGLGGSAVSFVSGETLGAALQGFTVTGGSGTLEGDGKRYGGGVYFSGSNGTLLNLIVRDNSADFGAGIGAAATGLVVATNSIVRLNHAVEQGGAVHMRGAQNVFVTNALIMDNDAGVSGGFLASTSSGLPWFRNSIIRHNGATPDAAAFSLIVNTNVEGGPLTNDNIDTDPKFVDPAGGNYRLRDDSPCIDTGSDISLPQDTTDLDGDGDTAERLPLDLDRKAREVDGDLANEDEPDMGPYERHRAGPAEISSGIGGPPLRVERLDGSGTRLSITWDDSCAAASTNILYGSLDQLPAHVLDGSVCSVSQPYTWDPAPAGTLWLLVVGEDVQGVEGSWGESSYGERHGALAGGECGATVKELSGICP
ncbi:MAG: hypothetical protein GY716_25845 [bacterium]|nr:hypothetical protein [bacterium]